MGATSIKLTNGPGGGLTLGIVVESDGRPPDYVAYWNDPSDGPQAKKLNPGDDLPTGGAAYMRKEGSSPPKWDYKWVTRLEDVE